MGFILIKVVTLEWPPLSEMNCGSNFGPELPGLLPNPAAEKKHSSFSDVHVAQVSHWRSLLPPFTTEAQYDVKSRGGGNYCHQHRYEKHVPYSLTYTLTQF